MSSTLAGPDQRRPPAGLAGDRVRVGDVLVAGQRMADQDRVAALGVERAIGLVGDRERAEIDAAIEPQRLLAPELRRDGQASIAAMPRAGAVDAAARSWNFAEVQTLPIAGLPRPAGRNQAVANGPMGVRLSTFSLIFQLERTITIARPFSGSLLKPCPPLRVPFPSCAGASTRSTTGCRTC